MVKIEVGKKDSVWIAFVIVLVGVGFVFAYNSGANPSVMGHSAGELEIDDLVVDNLVVNNNLVVNGEITLGGVARGEWPQTASNPVPIVVPACFSVGTKCVVPGTTISWTDNTHSGCVVSARMEDSGTISIRASYLGSDSGWVSLASVSVPYCSGRLIYGGVSGLLTVLRGDEVQVADSGTAMW